MQFRCSCTETARALLVHFWCTLCAVSVQFVLWIVGVVQQYHGSQVHFSTCLGKVHQKCTKSAPKVHVQFRCNCTVTAPKLYLHCLPRCLFFCACVCVRVVASVRVCVCLPPVSATASVLLCVCISIACSSAPVRQCQTARLNDSNCFA